MKFVCKQSVVWALCASASWWAQAQVSTNLAITSNYKFRGQDQDLLGRNGFAKDGAVKPAVQGGIDYSFGDSGFYAGNWNSSVNWLPGNSVEMDFYGGYKFSVQKIDLDVGALAYRYPGAAQGNTTEIYAAASYALEGAGTLAAKYSRTVSEDYFNYAGARSGSGLEGRDTGYLHLAYAVEVAPRLTLKASLGYTRLRGDIRTLGYRNYLDYGVGGAYALGEGLSLQALVQGANRSGAYAIPSEAGGGAVYSPNRSRLVLSLVKTL